MERRSLWKSSEQENTALEEIKKKSKLLQEDYVIKKNFLPTLSLTKKKDQVEIFEMMTVIRDCKAARRWSEQHHCRVVCEVKLLQFTHCNCTVVPKKMSSKDKFGNVGWKMGEGTILGCQMVRHTCVHSDPMRPSEERRATNKKQQIEV